MFGHFCECKREQVIREELGKGKARRVGGDDSWICILHSKAINGQNKKGSVIIFSAISLIL